MIVVFFLAIGRDGDECNFLIFLAVAGGGTLSAYLPMLYLAAFGELVECTKKICIKVGADNIDPDGSTENNHAQ